MHPLMRKGQVPAPQYHTGDAVTVGADAAVQWNKFVYTTGFLASNGQWGLAVGKFDGRQGTQLLPDIYELTAVYHAVTRLPQDVPIHVLTDSQHATACMDEWRDGSVAYPGGYDADLQLATPPVLEELRLLLLRETGRITWEWLPGHAGHPLNEFADTAAKLGMRAKDKAGRDATRDLPPQWASVRLADWYRRCRTPELTRGTVES